MRTSKSRNKRVAKISYNKVVTFQYQNKLQDKLSKLNKKLSFCMHSLQPGRGELVIVQSGLLFSH